MIEKIISRNKQTGFDKKTTTLSSGMYFIHRDINGNFSSKWSGIWAQNNKLIDYFAIKINDFWLSSTDVKTVESTPWSTKYNREIEKMQLNIKESNHATKNGIICTLEITNNSKEKKNLKLSLETAVNLRTKYDNWHTTTYTSQINEVRNCITVSSKNSACVYGAGRTPSTKITFNGNETYKDHYPGSKQRCFIPGTYTIDFDIEPKKTITIPLIFTKNIEDFDILHNDWQSIITKMDTKSNHNANTSNISTPISALDYAYTSSRYAINAHISNSFFGQGMFAGLPWFLEYWSRDTLWTALGLIDSGKFETVKNLLRTMAANGKNQIPTLINLNGTAKYYSADVDPLFLYVLHKYIKTTNDVAFANEVKKTIETLISNLKIKNNILIQENNGTWMDSIKREGTAIEVQSLWAKALERQKPGNQLLKGIHKFWSQKDKFLLDTYNIKNTKQTKMIKTANVLVPLMFGQIPAVNAKKTLQTIKTDFFSYFGIQTRGDKEINFDPKGYHTGSVWGLTTGWGACAFLKYDMIKPGVECLKSMAYDSERYGIGTISECLDAKTGELLGSPMQAWSSGLLVHAVDSYLFGISADLIKNELTLEPKLSDDWGHMYLHGKKVGNSTFDIMIDRTTYGIKIKIIFDEFNNHLKCKLKLPANCVKISIKGTKKEKHIESNKATFKIDEITEIKAKLADM